LTLPDAPTLLDRDSVLEVVVNRGFHPRAGGAALVLLAACGPKISEFSATPRRVCAGDTVRMTFKARGTPHLLAVRHGTATADTTSYLLVAEARGKRAYSPADVVTFSRAAQPALAFDTDLLGRDSLVARDTLSADAWPDALRLDEVFADSGRAIVVRHGGEKDTVSPGDEANITWQNLPVSGEWELRAGLLAGETPGDPAHAPPRHLYLRVSLSCGSEAGR
jgi:hypothetical protein